MHEDDVNFGRGSDRKYVIQRRFNYTDTIRKYISSAKQIKCQNSNCQKIHNYEMLTSLQVYDMFCPTCRQGKCEIEPVTVEMTTIPDNNLIPEFDISLLNTLKIEEPQYPTSLAQELDCTYQKASKRAIKLKDLGLVSSDKLILNSSLGERTYYRLTNEARTLYFNEQ